jgi:26S proteasome regulatory subunit N2
VTPIYVLLHDSSCNHNSILKYFIIFRTPEQFPSVVNLLAESYNPHVRCGAAMALGLACAGTGNRVNIGYFYSLINL